MSIFYDYDKEYFINLDKKFDKCAELAIQKYAYLTIDMQKNPGYARFELAYLHSSIDLYMKAFRMMYNVRFPDTKDSAIDEECRIIEQEFMEMTMQISEKKLVCPEFKIMLPIMFYVFVCNNAFNKSAHSKRETRKAKKAKNAENKNIDQAQADKPAGNKIQLEYERCHRNLCEITRKTAEDRSESKETFSEQATKLFDLLLDIERVYYKSQNKRRRKSFLKQCWEVDLAVRLVNYRSEFVYYEESALLGLFLRNLLFKTDSAEKPLDVLLRLYIANRIDRLIIRTGNMYELPPDIVLDSPNPNALLTWYYEHLHPLEKSDHTLAADSYVQNCVKDYEQLSQDLEAGNSKPLEQRMSKVINGDTEHSNEEFSTCYKELEKNFALFDYAGDIFSFYLNEDNLKLIVGSADKALIKKSTRNSLRHKTTSYIRTLLNVITSKAPLESLEKFDDHTLFKISRSIIYAKLADYCYNFDQHILCQLLDRAKSEPNN